MINRMLGFSAGFSLQPTNAAAARVSPSEVLKKDFIIQRYNFALKIQKTLTYSAYNAYTILSDMQQFLLPDVLIFCKLFSLKFSAMTIWNERYNSEDFLFGKDPNRFFKEVIEGLNPGRLLLPGEGEGRNAVYAARLGWEVDAFDASEVGKDKALDLAEQEGVQIRYDVGMVEDFESKPGAYDAISLIYCHLHPDIRKKFYDKLIDSLAPGGVLFIEGFRKEQLGLTSGGPRDPEMLFSSQQLAADFSRLSKLKVTEDVVWLDEGPGHQGEARVVRLTGKR